MPRLDNISTRTLVTLAEVVLGEVYLPPEKIDGIKARLTRKSTLFDVCSWCYRNHNFEDDVEHPPYNDHMDGARHCLICGDELTDLDN
jgi:hypothetical protein